MTDTVGPVEALFLAITARGITFEDGRDRARKIDAQMAALTEALQRLVDYIDITAEAYGAKYPDQVIGDDLEGRIVPLAREALRSVKEAQG